MILHPEVAAIPCRDCKVKLYNLETGKVDTYEGPTGERLEMMREGPPPCDSCPKGSPDREPLLQLTWRNRKVLQMYQRLRTPKVRPPRHLRECEFFMDLMVLTRTTIKSAQNESLERRRKKSEESRGDR